MWFLNVKDPEIGWCVVDRYRTEGDKTDASISKNDNPSITKEVDFGFDDYIISFDEYRVIATIFADDSFQENFKDN